MSAVMIVLMALCVIGAEIAGQNEFWPDYSSPRRSNALKGIFVLVVFVSHFRGYITLGDQDTLAVSIVSFFGQLMVTPFLFFSGFGVMESIRKKGIGYVRQIPVQRALKTWLHFALAVILFWVLNALLRIPMSGSQMLLSLIGWKTVGNSTWYIFTMFFLYLITAASFLVWRNREYAGLICTTILTCGYCVIMARFQGTWWYNTTLCYVLGMWYSSLRPYIEKFVMKNDLTYCFALLAAFYVFRQLMRFRTVSAWIYQVYAIFFMILLVGISMKLRLDNPILQFLGRHTFSIYMLQRLPMRFFEEKGLFADDHVTMLIFCFLLTCILAMAFDFLLERVDGRVFGAKRKV